MSLFLYVCPLFVDRQRLGEDVTAATNTHAAIEELLDGSFSLRSVAYKRKVGDCCFPELLVFKYAERLTDKLFWDRFMFSSSLKLWFEAFFSPINV
jgi:hypothetical protein